ncbi:MAG: TRAM domain-containing protein, partial [Sulfurovaceae bacterium]|nr:TRAM domain-containing protein [Sulfurovaceae bacterium]
ENQISNEIASKRLTALQARHTEIVDDVMNAQMDKIHMVYFDELKSGGRVSGRSDDGKLFFIEGSEDVLGQIKSVKVTKTSRGALNGVLL